MKPTPLLTLAALLCTLTLTACSNLEPPADFNLTRVYGKWYLLGLATNAPWLATYKDKIKMVTNRISPTNTGDVNTTYSMPGPDGRCWRKSHVIQKTKTPGRFTFPYTHGNETREYCTSVLEVEYDSYALLHTIQTKPTRSTHCLCEFHSRTTEASDTLRDNFVEFARLVGVERDNIVFLPNNGTC